MNSEIELKQLKKEIKELKKQVAILTGKEKIPTYQYSKIRETELKKLFEIEKKLSPTIFNSWFNNDIRLTEEIVRYLQELIEQNSGLVENYNEEDLKIYYIIPLLNKINFLLKDKEIRGFYELQMSYATDKFILNGTVDFVVLLIITY
jgi:glutaredoxin 2